MRRAADVTGAGRRVAFLVAHDDARGGALVAAATRRRLGRLSILEAADGAEAVQLGLQRRPAAALLAVELPRLGGFEAALTLRGLLPHLHVALHTAQPAVHREEARAHGLPLFDELQIERAVAWLEARALATARATDVTRPLQKLKFECSVCGYGVVQTTPPVRCVMCHSEDAWTHAAWRPYARSAVAGR
jgi:CheY-like chemotaxis protein